MADLTPDEPASGEALAWLLKPANEALIAAAKERDELRPQLASMTSGREQARHMLWRVAQIVGSDGQDILRLVAEVVRERDELRAEVLPLRVERGEAETMMAEAGVTEGSFLTRISKLCAEVDAAGAERCRLHGMLKRLRGELERAKDFDNGGADA